MPNSHATLVVVAKWRSFEAVTGEKRDDWLAQTTGGLIAAVGLSLLVGGRGRAAKTKRRISSIYLAAAVAEVASIAAWIRG